MALVVGASICLVAIVPLVVIVERGEASGDLTEWLVACFGPGFLVSGWWLVRRRPAMPLGWLFLAAGVSVAIAGLAAAYAGAAYVEGWGGVDWGYWVFSWLWQFHFALVAVAIILFPDGRFRRPWHRRLVWGVVAVTGLSILVSAVQPGVITTTPDQPAGGGLPGAINPLGIDALAGLTDALEVPLLFANVLVGLVPIGITASAWRRSDGLRRRQFRWVTLAQLIAVAAAVVMFALPAALAPLAIANTLAVQLVIVIAILQWGAYEIDVVVRRSILATSFLVVGLGTYALVVLMVSAAIGHSGPWPSAIGAAVAIFAFGPLSIRIKTAVNRALYGRRDDPYTVVAEMGRSLAAAADPGDALGAVVAALTNQLKLPYAAIVDDDERVIAARGQLGPDGIPIEIVLDYQGEQVGTLRVGRRRGSDTMLAAETELLDALSVQVGAAVHAHQLVAGLRTAREKLVVARQDERRRVQRDLHDGLGPRLTAVTLKLDAARNHLTAGRTDDTDELIGSARRDLHAAVGDVRRLVYSLGDPTVATLGLAAAITDQVEQLTGPSNLRTSVDIGEIPDLPAATEEAVHRVVSEAVTNVVRHANATACTVDVHMVGDRLHAEISDDGIGMNGSSVPGVGTRSMRDRALELGGSLDRVPGPSGGTVVRLCLPVTEAT